MRGDRRPDRSPGRRGRITPATKIHTNLYSRFGPATAHRGSRGIRDQPRNPPKYTEKRIRVNFPFPCPSRGRAHARRVGSFRGYPFVMIFLAGVIPFQLEVMGGIRLGARGRIRTRSGIGVRFAATHGGRTGLELTHHRFNLPINRCRLVMGLIQPGRIRLMFLCSRQFPQ